MSKKSPYQVGTKVRVINPEFFVRCGYPETLESARKKMESEFLQHREETLEHHLQNLFDINKSSNIKGLKFIGNFFNEWELDKILNVIARAYNREFLNFGGTERKVYTERKPEFENQIAYIQPFDKPLIKKSGTYVHGSGGTYDYFGEYDYDYDPSYLGNVKTHTFYPIGFQKPWTGGGKNILHNFDYGDYIEKTNFEIIDEENINYEKRNRN